MSVKKMKFSAAEKFKVALEAIKGELTVAAIASKYFVHPTQIGNWKKQALEYLAAAFTDRLKPRENNDKELSELYQQIGKLKVENDFLKKNVIYLSKDRKQLLEPEYKELSIRQQCVLLGINRSSVYYVKKSVNDGLLKLMRVVDEAYTQYPFFGHGKW